MKGQITKELTKNLSDGTVLGTFNYSSEELKV